MSDQAGQSPKVCAVCGMVLQRTGDNQWIHLAEYLGYGDHVAVPVDYDAIPVNVVCDFCHDTTPGVGGWVVPTENFEMPYVEGSNIQQQSVGHWSACEECVTLIRRRRWTQLVNRALDGYERSRLPATPFTRHARQVMKRMLTETYARLERSMIGPPRPWRVGDEKYGQPA